MPRHDGSSKDAVRLVSGGGHGAARLGSLGSRMRASWRHLTADMPCAGSPCAVPFVAHQIDCQPAVCENESGDEDPWWEDDRRKDERRLWCAQHKVQNAFYTNSPPCCGAQCCLPFGCGCVQAHVKLTLHSTGAPVPECNQACSSLGDGTWSRWLCSERGKARRHERVISTPNYSGDLFHVPNASAYSWTFSWPPVRLETRPGVGPPLPQLCRAPRGPQTLRCRSVGADGQASSRAALCLAKWLS